MHVAAGQDKPSVGMLALLTLFRLLLFEECATLTKPLTWVCGQVCFLVALRRWVAKSPALLFHRILINVDVYIDASPVLNLFRVDQLTNCTKVELCNVKAILENSIHSSVDCYHPLGHRKINLVITERVRESR